MRGSWRRIVRMASDRRHSQCMFVETEEDNSVHLTLELYDFPMFSKMQTLNWA